MLPQTNSMFVMPARSASARAFSIIAGVRSTPTARPTRGAKGRVNVPGPHATSIASASETSARPAVARSAKLSDSSTRMVRTYSVKTSAVAVKRSRILAR